jgi:Flp pilus assembly protein TadD
MNEDVSAEILAELRSLRRLSQYGAYSSFFFVLVAVAFLSWWVLDGQRGRALTSQPKPASTFSSDKVWSQISAALDEGDNGKAIAIANDFVTRRPNYYYAHEILGTTYIEMSDFTNAESAYVRAVELYPNEATEKTLAAIRKRLANDRTRGAK